ncbi:MAG: lipopolysaccharide biosynthesis protein [Acidovorax sp.]|uniref:lipopolysaccharide biosynthesis protein n=1 Tax=Acidovorax sp. TaxID=1872122 RepID=UPI00391BFA12
MTQNANPKRALIMGAMWTVGTRWSIKALGFVNTVIMARLILPADYGIVAMAMLFVAMVHAMTDLGVGTALLRKGEVSRDEIDSAWSLKIIQGGVLALVLMAGATLAASYFKEPRVQDVLWVFAACMLIDGASNIGLTLAQKDLKFSVDFRVNVGSNVVRVIVTLLAGYFFRDYRALVVGIVSGYVVTFVLSYALHPYRPRWNTSRMGEIWAVTRWLMLSSLGTFFLRRSDEIIAGRVGTTEEFGEYHVGGDLGRMPVSELGPPMVRAFLPVLSAIQDDLKRINAAVLKTVAAVNALTIPISAGVAAFAVPLTAVVLGPSWTQAASYVAFYALAAAAQFSVSPLFTLLVLRGHTRSLSAIVWMELVVFVVCVALLLPTFHLIALVWARLISSLFNAGMTAFYTHKLCDLRFGAVLQALWRPLAGAAGLHGMGMGITALPHLASWQQLVLGGVSGLALYSAWAFLSWWLVGRPEGLESTVVDVVQSRWRLARG